MVALPCLAVGFIMNVVAVLFALSALTLILIVLIQKGRGGGLSGALGGGGAGGVLGSKTGDFLTWVTIGAACVFILMAVVMAKFYRPDSLLSEATASTSTEQQDAGTGDMMTDTNEAAAQDEPSAMPSESNGVAEEVNQAAIDMVKKASGTLPTGAGQ